jgi:hypothetical protein
MNDAVILERRYRWLLRWYPPSFRHDNEDEVLGVLMAGVRDGRRWPSAAEAADVLWGALRMRFRLPRPGTQSPGWTDAWAVFSVLGPVFVLLTNIVVVLVPPYFLRVHAVNWAGYTGPMPTQARWLSTDLHAPYGWKPFATALICEAILVVLVLAGRRWASLVVLVASAALWVKSQYMFPMPVTLIDAGAGILELGALAASPGPRRGRSLLNWDHGVVLVLVIAAVKLSSMTFPALIMRPVFTTPLLAWVLLLSAGALVVIAGVAAIRLRLGWHTLWIGAALLYPYVLEFASIASGRSIVFWPGYYSDFLGFDVTSLHMVVVLSLGPAVMAMLAVLIAARGRLASSDARLTPGT